MFAHTYSDGAQWHISSLQCSSATHVNCALFELGISASLPSAMREPQDAATDAASAEAEQREFPQMEEVEEATHLAKIQERRSTASAAATDPNLPLQPPEPKAASKVQDPNLPLHPPEPQAASKKAPKRAKLGDAAKVAPYVPMVVPPTPHGSIVVPPSSSPFHTAAAGWHRQSAANNPFVNCPVRLARLKDAFAHGSAHACMHHAPHRYKKNGGSAEHTHVQRPRSGHTPHS